ncbi:MAG: Acetyl-coenzyme A synthetase [Methanoregulaceae archaeon PtaU1.Bin059]|nr:MAG: Acetyl-coenzyme A synthetase [Methanoregulaceae archaeon PtaB.Bin152]OPY40553.1 MAG: Acetyl-coenzyme A synthetase [Methanoregulaceae archaeon PtaU1.Bin059]
MQNLSTFLDNHALDPHACALAWPAKGERYTYRALLDMVRRLASALVECGLSKGDRVCIYLGSCPEYLVSYFALWRIGAVAVPANIVLKEGELRYLVENSGARGIICSTEGLPVVRAATSSISPPGIVICTGDAPKGTVSWSRIMQEEPSFPDPAPCRFDDPCQIQYTSGTTGRPKGAVLTQGNWIAALDAEREALALREGDMYLGIYPMAHVGVSWGISVLRAKGTYVIMERYLEEEYLRLAREYRITVLSAMPPVIHGLCSAPAGTEDSLGSVRVIISGGGQLLPAVWEAFDRRYGIPIANSYGLSETIVVGTGTATVAGMPELTREYRSVGIPIGYSEVRIVDSSDPGIVLGTGETGEIALRGPSVAAGYWDMPRETAETFLPEGWFLTGDMGHLDEGGALFITDRKKDMIVMSGWKIYPTEVENILLQHPDIADAAVFGVPDERKGEIPVAAVVARAGGHLDGDEVAAFCRSRMAGYKVPRRVVFVGSLPRVHGWKLLRRTLREEFSKIS